MEVRDSVHGIIPIDPEEVPIIESRYFQRLRQIKQLGFADHSFPGAVHSRFAHSLGAMHIASQVFDRIFRSFSLHPHSPATGRSDSAPRSLPIKTLEKWRSVLRLAALLHDVGHGPLSHTTEFAMPEVRLLQLPSYVPAPRPHRRASHEDYTLKMILDSGLSTLICQAGSQQEYEPIHVASLIDASIPITDSFFEVDSVDYRPLLRQIISSELDADRMDYLRRDSLYTGVSYGQFDFNWILAHLDYYVNEGKSYLCLEHRALYAFEDFLLSRFHMFLMVYFHHKTVVFDEMLAQYLSGPECEFTLPSEIEAYTQMDDTRLLSHLSGSKNLWAQRISQKNPYRILIELHSGIPASSHSAAEDKRLLELIQDDLKTRRIHFLRVDSTSELSKYFLRPGDPIFVRYDNHFQAVRHIPLEQCTDLFHRYGKRRTLSRIYVAPENFIQAKESQITST